MIGSGDVQYDFIWRTAAGDTTLVSFVHHFDPLDGSFTATLYDADANGIAAAAAAGDQLVWRWSVLGADGGAPGIGVIYPNGDGTASGGRFPSITLPTQP